MAPSSWTAEAERRLFLNIILIAAPRLPPWDQVAAVMGDGKTAEACRQHFNKLKRESNSKSVTSSPVKPITVSRKRKVIDVDTGNVDDEEDFGPVVIKCEPKKAKKEGKSEVFKDEAKPLEEDKSLYE